MRCDMCAYHIENFLNLNHPTFISSPFQSGVIAKKQDHAFFLGHPV